MPVSPSPLPSEFDSPAENTFKGISCLIEDSSELSGAIDLANLVSVSC